MPNYTQIAKIKSTELLWHPDTQTLSGEASTLFGGGTLPGTVIVESERTGKSRNFVYLEAHQNAEGEIEYWTYRGVGGYTLKIFND